MPRFSYLVAALLAFPAIVPAQEAKGKVSPELSGVVIPFLQKHCIACHGPEKKRGELTLHQYKTDDDLLKARKIWHHVAKTVHSGEMPPPEKKRPMATEADHFVSSLETLFDRYDRMLPPDPGRVTMRRLNRFEYRNTIRDLVGVDFDPSEDFPADDVGYGFDNIGDVLTVSPVHLERYLAAADTIMGRAILPVPPKAPVRHMSSKYLEPAGGKMPGVKFRPLTDGKFHTPFASALGGDFVLQIRVYGNKIDGEMPKLVFLCQDKELKTVEVKATEEKSAETIKVSFSHAAGPMRCAVKLANPGADAKEGAKKRTAFIEYIQLTGPSDTRPESHRKLLACDPKADKAAQTREVLKRFADHAYRRPATKPEVDRLVAITQKSEKAGDSWEAAVSIAMQAVLVSPKFLFRVELDDRPQTAQPKELDDYQLANRLSYFLWSSMPDDDLFDLAAKKQLHKNIDKQVDRMLKDKKAEALVRAFPSQWLQLRPLMTANPDPKLFPEADAKMRAAMIRETELFFGAIVKEDRNILEMIDGNWTYMNERLARHYGIADTNGNRLYQKAKTKPGEPIKGDEFVKVTFADKERGGLLTQASFLTVTSNPTRTSPVKRGRWVLEQILGTPPPAPPPDAPPLPESKQTKGTLRQRMEQHREDPACANCHARMDPIGFAFENFDAIGRFRWKDNEEPIDASGVLPNGRTFKGPDELKQILKEKKTLFARNVAEKLLTYGLGRGLELYDKRPVDRIVAALEKNDYRFSVLAAEIAKSEPFRLRRGKDTNP
jgi:hypothetical protein